MSINVNEIINKASNLSGEVFIVPNHSNTIDLAPDFMLKKINSICDINGVSFDKKSTIFAQIWICINDGTYTTNDLFSHCLNVARGVHIIPKDRSGFIPLDIIKNVKEGDTFKFTIPSVLEIIHYDDDEDKDDERIEFNMTLNLKATQQKYRYRNFGKFEDCLDFII